MAQNVKTLCLVNYFFLATIYLGNDSYIVKKTKMVPQVLEKCICEKSCRVEGTVYIKKGNLCLWVALIDLNVGQMCLNLWFQPHFWIHISSGSRPVKLSFAHKFIFSQEVNSPLAEFSQANFTSRLHKNPIHHISERVFCVQLLFIVMTMMFTVNADWLRLQRWLWPTGCLSLCWDDWKRDWGWRLGRRWRCLRGWRSASWGCGFSRRTRVWIWKKKKHKWCKINTSL